MLVNTTDYHLYPVVDTHEPEGIRPVRGFVSATISYTHNDDEATDPFAVGELRISFLDMDHNTYNSLTAEQLPMFMSAAKRVLEELEYPTEPDEWMERGAIITTAVVP